MANVKAVDIEVRVPFHWLSQHDHPTLTLEDQAFMAQCFLSPSTGLHLTYEQDGLEPSPQGGQTTMYRLYVGGQEAISYVALGRMMAIFAKVGTIILARAMDIEDGKRWEEIKPGDPDFS